jgi:hypothetical protein
MVSRQLVLAVVFVSIAGPILVVRSCGSVGAFRDAMWGGRLVIEPSDIDLGPVNPGEYFKSVAVTDHSFEPVILQGNMSRCGCIAVMGLPLTIPSFGHASLRVRVGVDGMSGRWERRTELLADGNDDSTVLTFSGVISRDSAAETEAPMPLPDSLFQNK